MREVARRVVRTALPHAVRTVLVSVGVLLLVVLTGIAPAPAGYQLGLTLLAALAVAAVTAWQVRATPTGDPAGAGGRHARALLTALLTALLQRREPGETLEERWARHVRAVDDRRRAGAAAPPASGATMTRERPVEAAEKRPAPPGPSRRRIAVVALTSIVLAALLWLPIGPPGRAALAVATFLVGYAAYALPLLPPLALGVFPPGPGEPVPW